MSGEKSHLALLRILGPIHVWALGVGIVLVGEFTGWNFSADKGGALAALIEEAPQTELNIDIPNGQVSLADVSFPAKLPDHAKEVLVDGKWDAIADLLEGLDAVKSTASRLPYIQPA
jgi:hypothetical protein